MLVILLLVAFGYGIGVMCRVILTRNYSTDLGVYLAAATAVRNHGDLYQASYDFDHYMYPPLFAVLLAPITPAPPEIGARVSVAFAVTTALWYVVSLICLALAVQALSTTLMRACFGPKPPMQPEWNALWSLRLLPVVFCLHCLGRELQLGQVDIFLLALLAMTIACAAAGRSYQAGLWHAAAICLKVMPLTLLLFPLWRRAWRWFLTCLGGMVLGLIVLPVLLLGYQGALKSSESYYRLLVLPAITGRITDHTRDTELFNQNAVHNYSLVGVMHNVENLAWERDDRRLTASDRNRHAAAALGFALILLTLLASSTRREISALATVLCLSLLSVLMAILSPVCQCYYFVLLIPLMMAVIAADLRRSGRGFPGRWVFAACAAYLVTQAVSSFCPLLRDAGIVLVAVLTLWLVGLKFLGEEALPVSPNPVRFPWPEGERVNVESRAE